MAFQRATEQRVSLITYDGQVPTAPTTPVVTLSQNGAVFTPATNALTNISGGSNTLILTTAETDCDALIVRVTSDNLEPHVYAFYFEAAWTSARAGYLDTIPDIIPAVLGTGAKAVTVAVEDDNGDPVPFVQVTVQNATLDATIAIQTTDSSGSTPQAFGLDQDTAYNAILSRGCAGTSYANPYEFTTADDPDAETVTLVCTVAAPPLPTDPDNYLLYSYERSVEADASFAAGAMVIRVVGIDVPAQTDADAAAMRAILGTAWPVDATGLWSFEIAKALDGMTLTLQREWTDARNIPQQERWIATIDATQADAEDRIAWAALNPHRKV